MLVAKKIIFFKKSSILHLLKQIKLIITQIFTKYFITFFSFSNADTLAMILEKNSCLYLTRILWGIYYVNPRNELFMCLFVFPKKTVTRYLLVSFLMVGLVITALANLRQEVIQTHRHIFWR